MPRRPSAPTIKWVCPPMEVNSRCRSLPLRLGNRSLGSREIYCKLYLCSFHTNNKNQSPPSYFVRASLGGDNHRKVLLQCRSSIYIALNVWFTISKPSTGVSLQIFNTWVKYRYTVRKSRDVVRFLRFFTKIIELSHRAC